MLLADLSESEARFIAAYLNGQVSVTGGVLGSIELGLSRTLATWEVRDLQAVAQWAGAPKRVSFTTTVGVQSERADVLRIEPDPAETIPSDVAPRSSRAR